MTLLEAILRNIKQRLLSNTLELVSQFSNALGLAR